MPVKLYAFIGPHASGRATMVSQLIAMGIPYIPTYTTKIFLRREQYKNSLYRTVKREQFGEREYIAKYEYQGNDYGIDKQEMLDALANNKVSVVMLGLAGIPQLKKFVKKEFETVYLLADQASLIDRMLRLNYTNDEIKYYINYAEEHKELEQWKSTDYVVKNIKDPSIAFEQVLAIMGLMQIRPQDEIDALLGNPSTEI